MLADKTGSLIATSARLGAMLAGAPADDVPPPAAESGPVSWAMAGVAVANIVAVLEGRQPPNCWNPEIYSRARAASTWRSDRRPSPTSPT